MKNLEKDVDLVTQKLVEYKNTNKLSWSGVYRDVLKSLGMEERFDEIDLLKGVVKKISWDGYDIIDNPFKLKRFK